jgi:ketosteroid isomerase-like protein
MTRLRLTQAAIAAACLGLVAFAMAACQTAGAAEESQASAARKTAARSPANSDEAVLQTLTALNDVLARRDLAGFMALFEDDDDIMLLGSDAGEVFRGRAEVGGFLKRLYGLPFTFAFDMPNATVRRKGHHAWLFADGAMVHKRADGSETRRPYRIVLVMKRHDDAWRWQLFSGSVPAAE